jgi:chemotaxis protein CheZ
MRPAQNRVFRIERTGAQSSDGPHILNDHAAQTRHDEIMSALSEIREGITPRENGATQEQEIVPQQLIETCQRDSQEALKIKNELKQIHDAINRTKREIATLHRGEYKGIEISRMTNELGAIVEGTEQATENILQAAEVIDNNAANLVAALKHEADHNSALDVQDQVIRIFEACNFQDLTGQRISKVVTAFGFIEERVTRMMEIWGGLESFRDIEPEASCARDEHEELLNGPALEDDENIASQDDVDALFG